MLGLTCRLVLSAAVYGLWRARNELRFGGHPRTDLKDDFLGDTVSAFWKRKIQEDFGEC